MRQILTLIRSARSINFTLSDASCFKQCLITLFRNYLHMFCSGVFVSHIFYSYALYRRNAILSLSTSILSHQPLHKQHRPQSSTSNNAESNPRHPRATRLPQIIKTRQRNANLRTNLHSKLIRIQFICVRGTTRLDTMCCIRLELSTIAETLCCCIRAFRIRIVQDLTT